MYTSVLSLLVTAPPAIFAAGNDEAIAVVNRLHERLVEVATTEPALNLDERFDALAPVVRETHDLTDMGRRTVRRFWRAWTEDQRALFSDAFERLSIRTYASRFASIGPDVFAVVGASETREGVYEVSAIIRRSDDDNVPIRYQLQLEGEQWRISNVFADGVSELSLMGSEYFDILESGSLEDLLSELESQIAEL